MFDKQKWSYKYGFIGTTWRGYGGIQGMDGKGLLQIPDQIFRVLYPYGKAYHAGGDAECAFVLQRHPRVGHGIGVLRQRFGTTEAHGQFHQYLHERQ